MVKRYIDFDDVIVNTEDLLFVEYKKLKSQGFNVDKIKYMQEYDWYNMLCNCEVISDAIEILKGMRDAIILTKIHSMENEGVAKIKFLRENGISNDIILSPYLVKKTEMVNPKGNILVDDSIANLNDWYQNGGIPIFFNKDGIDFDSWGVCNERYLKIRTLEELRNLNF